MVKTRKKWQLQEAKNKFSEVVRKALEEGPQTVTKHGKDSVVVMSAHEFYQVDQHKETITDFFKKSPLSEVNLNLDRKKELPRKDDL